MISYQNDCLCDWRTTSCTAHGHLQTRHVSFVKLSRGVWRVYVDSVGRRSEEGGLAALV